MIRNIPDWLLYGLGICIYMAVAKVGSTSADAPSPLPELGPPLQTERPSDGSLSIIIDDPSSGTGTAFAVDNKGAWLTARHVVDSCDDVVLYIGGREAIRAEGYQINENADTALIYTKWKREPLAQDLLSTRRIGEAGYFFGFPQGKSGEVAGNLIGQRRMIVRGRYRSNEPVLVWAERGRSRGLSGSLGGLSGGPVLDADGEVIGVISAESRRRGRIYTVAPRQIRPFMPVTKSPPSREDITDKNYGRQADRLRNSRRITKVICYVKK